MSLSLRPVARARNRLNSVAAKLTVQAVSSAVSLSCQLTSFSATAAFSIDPNGPGSATIVIVPAALAAIPLQLLLLAVGALVVGAFIITTAVGIFWNSIDTLFDLINGNGNYQGSAQITLWIALGTILLKIFLSIYTRHVGQKTNNAAVQALGYDHRNDIFSASAAALGIFFSQLGYLWVDPLAGAIVALVILRTGIVILRDSSLDLMDTIPGKLLREQVESLIRTISEVKQIDNIQAHRFGQYLVINLTIGLDGNISVFEGDRISSLVEKTLLENI